MQTFWSWSLEGLSVNGLEVLSATFATFIYLINNYWALTSSRYYVLARKRGQQIFKFPFWYRDWDFTYILSFNSHHNLARLILVVSFLVNNIVILKEETTENEIFVPMRGFPSSKQITGTLELLLCVDYLKNKKQKTKNSFIWK